MNWDIVTPPKWVYSTYELGYGSIYITGLTRRWDGLVGKHQCDGYYTLDLDCGIKYWSNSVA